MIRRIIIGIAVCCAIAGASAEIEGDARAAGACNPGTVLWHRDSQTSFCATLCTGDAVCGEGERCRSLDVVDDKAVPDVVFLDDLPDEERAERLTGLRSRFPPIAVCDPFFDVAGALDADIDSDR